MERDNLTAVMQGLNTIRMEQREVPTPKSRQLLIKIHTTGICGSDVHFLTNGRIGNYIVKEPMVLGHESCGIVEKVGENVSGFTEGDRIVMEPGIHCKTCQHCKTGRYNLCENTRFFATPPTDGTLTRFMVHDAEYCLKLPSNVSFEDAAMIEPLSVGVMACRRSQLQLGQTVWVLGAGPIGIMCMLTAKAQGAGRVVVSDIDDHRLQLAKEIGADYIINVKDKSPEQVRKEFLVVFGAEPEVCLECTGAQSSVESAIITTRSGGVIVMVGLGAARVELPIIDAAIREVDLRGTFRYANCHSTALGLLASGRIDLSGVTRAHYKLEDTVEAFERSKKGDVLKVFIHS